MTEEQKEKYANFLDKVSEILGLNKPVDILRLCAVTDEYLKPLEKHIAELEKENAELKEEMEAKQVVLNDFKSRVETVTDRLNEKASQLAKTKALLIEFVSK